MVIKTINFSSYTFFFCFVFFGAEAASIYSKVHRKVALHHIIASMQSNAQSTSCYYLCLVTQGYAVCGLTGFLVA